MVRVNGKEEDASGMTVAKYIDSKGYDKAKVAVEINMDILPRCDYDLRELKNGDTVEIVSFVGGG